MHIEHVKACSCGNPIEGGYKDICIKCYQKAWRLRNLDKIRSYNKKWNGQRPKTSWQDLPEAQREAKKKYQRHQNHLRKLRVMEKYGGLCQMCGCIELSHLSIDHVNNDGRKDRERLKSGGKFYAELLRTAKRKDLQVLCMGCQFAKRTPGVCTKTINVYSLAEYAARCQ